MVDQLKMVEELVAGVDTYSEIEERLEHVRLLIKHSDNPVTLKAAELAQEQLEEWLRDWLEEFDPRVLEEFDPAWDHITKSIET